MLPADVPIHRPSVGAMGVATGPRGPTPEQSFKPYVYRGWDVDLFTDLPPVSRPVPPEKPRADVSRPRRRPVAQSPTPNLDAAMAAAREAERMLMEMDRADTQRNKPAKVKRKKAKKRKKHKAEAAPSPIPSLPRSPVRPSRGWQPMTGADLEEIWAELEDNQ